MGSIKVKLEDQVVSLELAKKLKSLNVKQESVLYWAIRPTGQPSLTGSFWALTEKCEEKISAFTVSELGEILPGGFLSFKERSFISEDPDWKGGHLWGSPFPDFYPCKTEVDARGRMLIYLLENGLMDAKNIK